MAWWETLFDETYLRLWAPQFSEERTHREVEGVERLLELQPGMEVLDLCCGQGRLTVPLARRGYRMTGLDLSKYLLEVARQSAAEASVQVEWHRADMRHIPWESRFDAVINVFTAFGYFEDEADNQRVLEEVHRALRPHGRFLIDLPNRDGQARLSEGHTWFEAGEIPVWAESEFDAIHGVSHARWHWMEKGERRSLEFNVRIYTPTEMREMLLRAGLHWRTGYLDWEGGALTHDSRRMIILAEKEE